MPEAMSEANGDEGRGRGNLLIARDERMRQESVCCWVIDTPDEEREREREDGLRCR